MGAKFSNDRWIDLGDLGQHKAHCQGTLGDYGYVSSLQVDIKGETIELVHLLPREYESLILEEEEINYREYQREAAEDWRFEAGREAA